MLCIGITDVVLKESHEPRVVMTALVRRSRTEGFDTMKVWLTPKEYEISKVHLGDQFRAFKEGGIMKIDVPSISLDALNDVL